MSIRIHFLNYCCFGSSASSNAQCMKTCWFILRRFCSRLWCKQVLSSYSDWGSFEGTGPSNSLAHQLRHKGCWVQTTADLKCAEKMNNGENDSIMQMAELRVCNLNSHHQAPLSHHYHDYFPVFICSPENIHRMNLTLASSKPASPCLWFEWSTVPDFLSENATVRHELIKKSPSAIGLTLALFYSIWKPHSSEIGALQSLKVLVVSC